MNNEITSTKAFQERMFEKIRDQMGDLLTDEDLKNLVNSAMQQAFFEPIIEKQGYHDVKKPPFFISMIQKQTQELVNDQVKIWIDNNPEQISNVIKETIEAGIFKMIAAHFERKTSYPLQELMAKLCQKGVL